MSTQRFRLVCVLALALVGGVVSQSAGASSAAVAPGSRVAGAVPQWLSARQMPFPGGVGAGFSSSGLRSSSLHSLATDSRFTNIGIDFGSTYVSSATWADYDSDGRLDLLILGSDPSPDFSTPPVADNKLYHNNGDGTFSENKVAGLSNLYGSVASWADYDSDGRLDVLISGCSDAYCTTDVTTLYHNNGDGTFSENTRAGLPGVRGFIGSESATWSDYDLDGRPDVLITGMTDESILFGATSASGIALPTTARLYHNTGDGTFSEDTSARFPGLIVGGSAWSDYDGDGLPDLLLTGLADSEPLTPVTKLYHNNGDGSFSENTAVHLPGEVAGWKVAWGDYNGDGFADILINDSPDLTVASLTPSATTRIFRNNADGTFSEDTAAGLPDVGDAEVVWGDFNGDGRLDVALNGCPGSCIDNNYVTELYLNDGDGTFSKDASAGLPADLAWLAPGDYNSDGSLDLLVYGPWLATNNDLYRNNTAAAAAPDSPTQFESHLLRGGAVKLSWRVSGSQTLDNSVTYNLRVGTTPGGSDIVSPLAGPNGVRQVAAFGNTGGRNFAILNGLHSGTYYWSVQSVGANYMGSNFALQHDFTIAPTPTLKLLRTKIFACQAGPRTTKVFGKVSPGYYSATVALQKRFVDGAGWKAIAKKDLSSRGTYSFAKVGKGVERSFWLRVRVRSQLGTVVSPSAQVVVMDAAACAKP
jgi:hypothetical protein